MLGEPLYRSAFASGVATLEQDHQPLARILDPVLKLQQLDLQEPLDDLVVRTRHTLAVWVAFPPRINKATVFPPQDRLVLVIGLVEHKLVEML